MTVLSTSDLQALRGKLGEIRERALRDRKMGTVATVGECIRILDHAEKPDYTAGHDLSPIEAAIQAESDLADTVEPSNMTEVY